MSSNNNSYKQYGKSSAALLSLKTSFFEDNNVHLAKQKKLSHVYLQQPKRTHCKNCNHAFTKPHDFIKDNIEYILCEACNHLNGAHEDTDEFCQVLYTDDSGSDYARDYTESNIDDYNYRTASIYSPKAEFLYTSLKSKGVNPHELSYLDFGSGAGYFVSALKKIGLRNISGTEVSETQVAYGNVMMQDNLLHNHNLSDTQTLLSETKSNVISMIGVLEHLQSPRDVLASIKNNSNIEYLYISVPTFSLSVYLEIFSEDVFHRQLHGGHTHLYTEESLSYLCNEFGFDIASQWWFGSDFVDLYRHMSVILEKQGCSTTLTEKWKESFIPILDAVQLEVDKKHFSSEVHMLLKKRKNNTK